MAFHCKLWLATRSSYQTEVANPECAVSCYDIPASLPKGTIPDFTDMRLVAIRLSHNHQPSVHGAAGGTSTMAEADVPDRFWPAVRLVVNNLAWILPLVAIEQIVAGELG